YKELLTLHVVPRLGSVPAQKLTGVHIQGLYSTLRLEGKRVKKSGEEIRTGLSEQTILHVHRVLSQALSEATRKRVIARNPADDVLSPKPKKRRASKDGDGNGQAMRVLDRE